MVAVKDKAKPVAAPIAFVEPVTAIAVKPKAKMGRPPSKKADLVTVKAICDLVSEGLSVESALVLQGIPHGSTADYLKRYPHARQAIAEAEGNFEKKMLAHLVARAPKDPKVTQWLLERRLNARFAPTNRTELSGPGGGPVQQLTVSKALFATVAAGNDRPKARPMKTVKAMVAESKSVALPSKSAT